MHDERAKLMKVVWVMRYLPTVNRERAQRYWRTHHAGLGRRVWAMPWYLQNHWVEAIGPTGVAPDREPDFGGYSVAWFDGMAGFQRCTTSPEMLTMDADAFNIFDVEAALSGWSAILDETVTVLSETPEVELFKVAWTARYRPGLDRHDAHREWIGGHRELLNRVPGIRRHALNHALEVVGVAADGVVGDIPLRFDGITELWFDDRPSYERAMSSPAWRAVLDDAGRLFDLDAAWEGAAGVVDHAWISERL
jgi:hypothetical protein